LAEANEAKGLDVSGHGIDWPELRHDVRSRCRKAASALRRGRPLATLQVRPPSSDLKSAREDLTRVLAKLNWSGFSASGGESIPTDAALFDMIVQVCSYGHALSHSWAVILELIEAGAAEPLIRSRDDPNVAYLDDREQCVFLRMQSERVEAFRLSRTPIEKPNWDRGTGRLSLGADVCREFKRFADGQYRILDSFHEKHWSPSVDAPDGVSRQTVYDLNRGLKQDCPIRFRFSEKGHTVSWERSR